MSLTHRIILITQVADDTCIARLVAFGDDAERLLQDMVLGAKLKFNNLQWTPANRQFQGACTCPVEFRAMKNTTVEVCEFVVGPADLRLPPPASIPSSVPSYVLLPLTVNVQYTGRTSQIFRPTKSPMDSSSCKLLHRRSLSCSPELVSACNSMCFHAQNHRDTSVLLKRAIS